MILSYMDMALFYVYDEAETEKSAMSFAERIKKWIMAATMIHFLE